MATARSFAFSPGRSAVRSGRRWPAIAPVRRQDEGDPRSWSRAPTGGNLGEPDPEYCLDAFGLAADHENDPLLRQRLLCRGNLIRAEGGARQFKAKVRRLGVWRRFPVLLLPVTHDWPGGPCMPRVQRNQAQGYQYQNPASRTIDLSKFVELNHDRTPFDAPVLHFSVFWPSLQRPVRHHNYQKGVQ